MNRVFVVNFGISQGGLSTVGYTLYNRDGTEKQTRTISGVYEVGTNTGIYAVDAPIDDDFDGTALWDNGRSAIRYAAEEAGMQMGGIQSEIQFIRLIWNTLKNQADFYTRLVDKVDKLKDIIEAMGRIVSDLSKKKYPDVEDIRKVLTITVKPAEFNISEVPISSDYLKKVDSIENLLFTVRGEVTQLTKTQKTHLANFGNVMALLKSFEKKITESNKYFFVNGSDEKENQEMLSEVKSIQKSFIRLDGIISNLREKNGDPLNPKNAVSQQIKDFNSEILMSLGQRKKNNG